MKLRKIFNKFLIVSAVGLPITTCLVSCGNPTKTGHYGGGGYDWSDFKSAAQKSFKTTNGIGRALAFLPKSINLQWAEDSNSILLPTAPVFDDQQKEVKLSVVDPVNNDFSTTTNKISGLLLFAYYSSDKSNRNNNFNSTEWQFKNIDFSNSAQLFKSSVESQHLGKIMNNALRGQITNKIYKNLNIDNDNLYLISDKYNDQTNSDTKVIGFLGSSQKTTLSTTWKATDKTLASNWNASKLTSWDYSNNQNIKDYLKYKNIDLNKMFYPNGVNKKIVLPPINKNVHHTTNITKNSKLILLGTPQAHIYSDAWEQQTNFRESEIKNGYVDIYYELAIYDPTQPTNINSNFTFWLSFNSEYQDNNTGLEIDSFYKFNYNTKIKSFQTTTTKWNNASIKDHKTTITNYFQSILNNKDHYIWSRATNLFLNIKKTDNLVIKQQAINFTKAYQSLFMEVLVQDKTLGYNILLEIDWYSTPFTMLSIIHQ